MYSNGERRMTYKTQMGSATLDSFDMIEEIGGTRWREVLGELGYRRVCDGRRGYLSRGPWLVIPLTMVEMFKSLKGVKPAFDSEGS
jgi:hypothetical protein